HVERSLGSLPVLPLPIQLDQAPGRVEVAPVVPQRLLEVADRPGAVAALEEEAAGLEEARRARTGLRRVGGLLQQVLEITLRVAPLEGELLEGLDGGDVAGIDLARLEEGGARRVRIEKHLAVDASHAVVELRSEE